MAVLLKGYRHCGLYDSEPHEDHYSGEEVWVDDRHCRTAACRGGRRRLDTGLMVDDTSRDLAIYHALKAVDEVAAALQAHLIEEHAADPERAAAYSPATHSLTLLRQARERLGQGLRAIEADAIAE